ncbi:hypothetical protein M0802_008767 [Mischocyttarus mexicanus]|nr:hypothetical protein M0802_008767 [Mischocyttarus mexicanus]
MYNWQRASKKLPWLPVFNDTLTTRCGLIIMMDEIPPKTLYVGNLDQSVSEDLLCALFSQIGVVRDVGIKNVRLTFKKVYILWPHFGSSKGTLEIWLEERIPEMRCLNIDVVEVRAIGCGTKRRLRWGQVKRTDKKNTEYPKKPEKEAESRRED